MEHSENRFGLTNQTPESRTSGQPGMQEHRQADRPADSNSHNTQTSKSVTLNMRLLDYLCQEDKDRKPDTKLTRLQAYYDLLIKQQMAEVMENPNWIDRGFKQLAKDWNWNRMTVSSFIDKLITEKAAHTISYGGKTIVVLNNISGLPDNICRILQSSDTRRRPDSSRPNAQNSPDGASSSLSGQ